MWWRPAWFSLKGTGSIRSQTRGAVLPHPAFSTNHPADPCNTAYRALAGREALNSQSEPFTLLGRQQVRLVPKLDDALAGVRIDAEVPQDGLHVSCLGLGLSA